jgi:metal-responsive CopG/Arc/MetJ family transcriptional regulator
LIWLAVEKVGCLPDELLRRIDEQAERGQARPGSQQIAELIAEFGLQHDEWEMRRAQDEAKLADDRRRTERPIWRRAR